RFARTLAGAPFGRKGGDARTPPPLHALLHLEYRSFSRCYVAPVIVGPLLPPFEDIALFDHAVEGVLNVLHRILRRHTASERRLDVGLNLLAQLGRPDPVQESN